MNKDAEDTRPTRRWMTDAEREEKIDRAARKHRADWRKAGYDWDDVEQWVAAFRKGMKERYQRTWH